METKNFLEEGRRISQSSKGVTVEGASLTMREGIAATLAQIIHEKGSKRILFQYNIFSISVDLLKDLLFQTAKEMESLNSKISWSHCAYYAYEIALAIKSLKSLKMSDIDPAEYQSQLFDIVSEELWEDYSENPEDNFDDLLIPLMKKKTKE